MDYSEAAERISRKFSKSGQTVDVKKIESKLKRLVDEFGVQPQEAERSVTNELNKEFNIPVAGSGGGGRADSANEQKKIAEGMPGDWITLEGKIVALSAPASPSIAQSGIIADESGAIRFVAWAKSNAPRHGGRILVPYRVRGGGRVQGHPQPEDPLGDNGERDHRGTARSSPHSCRSGTCTPVSRESVPRWSRNGMPAMNGCSSPACWVMRPVRSSS